MSDSPERFSFRLMLVVALSILVYTLGGYNYFMTVNQKTIAKVASVILTYMTYKWARENHPSTPLEEVAYGFFTISLGFLAAWMLRDLSDLIHVPPDSIMDWAVGKVTEAVPICATILLLRRGKSLGLKRGNIGHSLGYGLAASLLGFVQYFVMVGFRFPSIGQFFSWLPWLFIFSFSNGFMEELMFRGLFMESYSELFGERGGLMLISIIFAVFHVALLPFMGWTMVLGFVFFLFFQGYIWGFILQRTKSIWGAVLAHAVADILFVVAAFLG